MPGQRQRRSNAGEAIRGGRTPEMAGIALQRITWHAVRFFQTGSRPRIDLSRRFGRKRPETAMASGGADARVRPLVSTVTQGKSGDAGSGVVLLRAPGARLRARARARATVATTVR